MSTVNVDNLLKQIKGKSSPDEAVKYVTRRLRAIARLNGEAVSVWQALADAGVTADALTELQEKADKIAYASNVSARIENDLKAWGYSLWLDDRDDSVWDGPKPFTDADDATLRMRARDEGYAAERLLEALKDATLAIAARNRRHPLKELLSSLKWDGKDHIAHLSCYVTCGSEPIAYPDGSQRTEFDAYIRRWLVGAVAKIFGDGDACRDNFVLVLAGDQGIGKSHFASWLAPSVDYFLERRLDPDDKDASLARARYAVWELGELGSVTKRADVEALKSHITATIVTERRPYGKFDIRKPAICSYIGSVNPDGAGYLADSTGNRRFAVVDVESIDWAYFEDVSHAGLWAQAVAMWRDNPKAYRFAKAENERRELVNSQNVIVDLTEDAIATFTGKSQGSRVTALELRHHMRTYAGMSFANERSAGMSLSKACKKVHGISPKRTNGVNVYEGLTLVMPAVNHE